MGPLGTVAAIAGPSIAAGNSVKTEGGAGPTQSSVATTTRIAPAILSALVIDVSRAQLNSIGIGGHMLCIVK